MCVWQYSSSSESFFNISPLMSSQFAAQAKLMQRDNHIHKNTTIFLIQKKQWEPTDRRPHNNTTLWDRGHILCSTICKYIHTNTLHALHPLYIKLAKLPHHTLISSKESHEHTTYATRERLCEPFAADGTNQRCFDYFFPLYVLFVWGLLEAHTQNTHTHILIINNKLYGREPEPELLCLICDTHTRVLAQWHFIIYTFCRIMLGWHTRVNIARHFTLIYSH